MGGFTKRDQKQEGDDQSSLDPEVSKENNLDDTLFKRSGTKIGVLFERSSDLRERLKDFLPKICKANEQLELETDKESINIEAVDEEKYIEMNVLKMNDDEPLEDTITIPGITGREEYSKISEI